MMMPALEVFGGLTYLLLAGDLLVRGAVALSRKAQIPPMIVGLTVVAFGTSAPELFVSLRAALGGSPDIAMGACVVGGVTRLRR